ncbi:MAG: hypothetical protein J5998_10290 [Clostridia bacterium]|nr:hypothetical protein [Clostridia bacterium]
MRKMLRVLSLLCLLAVAAASFAPFGYADGSGIPAGLTMEKVGEIETGETIPDTSNDVAHWMQAMYRQESGIKYLDGGLYAVAGESEDVNRIGLFDENGEQLIPFEAALIKRLGDRYLMVYYATEKTENKKEALLYISDGFFIGQGLPKDGDVMYKGYARFYDREMRRFVGDLVASDFNYSTGRLLVLEGNYTLKTGIYDENGELLSDQRMKAGRGYLIKGNKEVYDETLTLRYTSDTNLENITGADGYMKKSIAGGGYQVIDIDGNVILPGPFKSVYDGYNGFFSVQKEDGSYALIDAQNRVLASSAERFTRLCAGYYYGKDGNGFIFVGPDGIVADGLPHGPATSLQVYYNKTAESEARTLVLDSGEWTLPLGGGNALCPGITMKTLIKKEGKYSTVYNLFTGDVLLEGMYDSVWCVGEFVLAQRGTVREIYKIQYQYR